MLKKLTFKTKMKKILLGVALFPIFGIAQVSIPSSSFAGAGDNLLISVATVDQTIDFQTTGPNQTWDFSQLIPEDQKINVYSPVSTAGPLIQLVFGTFAPAKYAASYFLPNNTLPFESLPPLLPITIDDISSFYKVTPTFLNQVGYSLSVNGTKVPARSDTIEKKYNLPIVYGNTHTSRGYTQLDLNPTFDGIWIQHRKRETEVDGWGSITTPLGTYDALRIHHRIEETDSFYVSFNGLGIWIPIPVPVSHEYEWRSPNEKEHLLKITTSVFNNQENVTGIEYRDNVLLGIHENTIEMSVYPNPATDFIQLSAGEKMKSYTLQTMEGKIVETTHFSPSFSAWIATDHLPAGNYLITVQFDGNNGNKTVRFVK
jgi:hypothetical protein